MIRDLQEFLDRTAPADEPYHHNHGGDSNGHAHIRSAFIGPSSLASLLSLAASPLLAWWLRGDLQLVEFAAILAVLIWSRHLGNLRRLLRGEESKIGLGKREQPPA